MNIILKNYKTLLGISIIEFTYAFSIFVNFDYVCTTYVCNFIACSNYLYYNNITEYSRPLDFIARYRRIGHLKCRNFNINQYQIKSHTYNDIIIIQRFVESLFK